MLKSLEFSEKIYSIKFWWDPGAFGVNLCESLFTIYIRTIFIIYSLDLSFKIAI